MIISNLQGAEILNLVSFIMIFGIIVVYGFSFFWNLKCGIIGRKIDHAWSLNMYSAGCSLLFIIIDSFLLICLIMNSPVDISFFSGIVIRPAIFLVGAGMASHARLRYIKISRKEGDK